MPIVIDGKLLREIRELADFVVKLPERLATIPLDVGIARSQRKERLKQLKEIANLREIGKCLITIYSTKGGLAPFFDVDPSNDDDVIYIKGIFEFVIDSLEGIQEILEEGDFSDVSLATEASEKVAKYIAIYKMLLQISDSDLSTNNLSEIGTCIQIMQAEGSQLIKKLDDQRRLLDHTFG